MLWRAPPRSWHGDARRVSSSRSPRTGPKAIAGRPREDVGVEYVHRRESLPREAREPQSHDTACRPNLGLHPCDVFRTEVEVEIQRPSGGNAA
jgi:hypothetical protein